MFIENFRPGTLEQMGLAPDDLLARNPKLIVVAHLGLRADRALCAAAGVRHHRRGHERVCAIATAFRIASRCCRRWRWPT